MSRWCYPKINHNIYGNQANNNTKINISHSFKDTEVKLSFKSSSIKPNKISLSLPQCFNLIRVHPLAKGLFPTNPIPEVPLSGRLQLFCLILAKLTQDPSILNIYCSRIWDSFSQKPCAGKVTQPSSFG